MGSLSCAKSCRSIPFRWWSFLRSEEHTSELQSRPHLVCRLLLEKKNAVVAAVAAQASVPAAPWPARLSLSVRVAVISGEEAADARDSRTPAANRCAKLRRRAVGR